MSRVGTNETVRETWLGALAVTRFQLRARLRVFSRLLRNPLTVLLALALVIGYIATISYQASEIGRARLPTARLEWMSFGYGLLLLFLAWSAQQGSPLRISLADVAWLVQSPRGPEVAVAFFGIFSSVTTFFGVLAGSAVALVVRGESLFWSCIAAVAAASLTLFARGVSLCAHLLGQRTTRRLRILLRTVLGCLVLAWIGGFVFLQAGSPNATFAGWLPTALFRGPFTTVVSPELGLSPGVPALGLLAGALMIRAWISASSFMEPAAMESIISSRLAHALAGGPGRRSLQSGGYRSSIPSVRKWPDHLALAVATAHCAQFRRRLRPFVGTIVFSTGLIALLAIFRDAIPPIAGGVLVLLLVPVSVASQSLATDLDLQHLRLSGAPLFPVGAAGVLSNALSDFVAFIPATLVWGVLHLGAPLAAFVLLPLLLGYCVMTSVIGIAARAFADGSIGRVGWSLALTSLPLLAIASSLDTTTLGSVSAQFVVTTGVTLAAASAIYGLMAAAALIKETSPQ